MRLLISDGYAIRIKHNETKKKLIELMHASFNKVFKAESRIKISCFVIAAIMVNFCVVAQPVTRIYLGNDDHTDYMWTANEEQYDSAFVHMLDYYLRQIDSSKSFPSDFQCRFNCDGSYWLRAYERFRSPAQFDKLMKAIGSRHISSPLNLMVSTYGAQPAEAVLRGMYYAGSLERKYKLRFPLAVAMENQTIPLGLSSLWAGAGAKYSWRGVCGCASRIPKKNLSSRRLQLYKYTGMDSRSVTMKWYNRGVNNVMPGGYAETRFKNKPVDTLKEIGAIVASLGKMMEGSLARQSYPFDAAAAFGYGWDDLATYTSAYFINAARDNTTATRKVRVSNEEDFFKYIDEKYPAKLPSERLSYGNEWDLYCASMNETTARVRRSTEKLRSAEALATLVALKKKDFAEDIKSMKELAWESFGMYWEHDWTADGPISRKERAAWQNKIQQQISNYVDTLFNSAVTALSAMMPKGNFPRAYVFNSLGWFRSDAADIEYNGELPVRAINTNTGKEIPVQQVSKSGRNYLRIWADSIPPTGYIVFELRPGQAKTFDPVVKFANGILENKYYRIALRKSGVITELYDLKAGNRQLVKPQYGRYLNDLGTSNPDSGDPLVVESEGPVSLTVKAVSQEPVAHTVRVTVYRDNNRVEIEDSIQSNFRDVKTWAFSTALQQQTTRHEEVGAILDVRRDVNNGHYSSKDARYDWQTFNHFADLSERNYGLTISNLDCSFFQLGNSTPDSLWENSPQLNALAGGQVDSSLGILNQDGATDFGYHFALSTHQMAFDPVAAMKFALEAQNPLVASMITGTGIPMYPATKYSMLQVSDPGVLLWSLKPSEDGIEHGVITRFWNLHPKAIEAVIRIRPVIGEAWQTTHIETNENKLKASNALRLKFGPLEMNTYRIKVVSNK